MSNQIFTLACGAIGSYTGGVLVHEYFNENKKDSLSRERINLLDTIGTRYLSNCIASMGIAKEASALSSVHQGKVGLASFVLSFVVLNSVTEPSNINNTDDKVKSTRHRIFTAGGPLLGALAGIGLSILLMPRR